MKALVLLSGGMDSTIATFWAKEHYDEVETIGFDYGQKHLEKEINSAYNVAQAAGVPHIRFNLSVLYQLGDSALLKNSGQEVEEKHRMGTLPASFVPGRNILFLTVAASYAYKVQAQCLIGGMCQTDYSGYPDCRHDFILFMQKALRKGLDYSLSIITPFMYMTKADEVQMARDLPGCFSALSLSHTCYNGQYPPCGKCPACLLREKGFQEAGLKDPLILRATREGKI